MPGRKPKGARGTNQYQVRGYSQSKGVAATTLARSGLLGRSPWVMLRRTASDPSTAPNVLNRLGRSKDHNVLLAVASNTNTPARTLERLAASTDAQNQDIRTRIAHNPTASPAALDRLVDGSSVYGDVRITIADHSHTSAKTLARLIVPQTSNTPRIRRAVAMHRSATSSLLIDLAHSDDTWTRQLVAGNPHCPVDTLIQLVGDHEPTVRIAAAQNVNLPPHIKAIISLGS